ncbi:acrosin, partial [Dryobates pubescens]|uniref:acrosin n=1 Tax=Dryobates pubescens TaxID=118200 RepID=UPI0023B9DAA5
SAHQRTCGTRPKARGSGTSHTVGGTRALPGAWPWVVSIQDPQRAGSGHICGGSLVGSRWVLTAAHCFVGASPVSIRRNISKWRVVAGASRLSRLGAGAQVRQVKQLLAHPAYSRATQSNDIALLELGQPLRCGGSVQPACLPDGSLRVRSLTNCFVSSWASAAAKGERSARAGRARRGAEGPTDVLQEAKVHLMTLKLCNSSRWYNGTIPSRVVCAGYPWGGVHTCQGDSGGPLACRDKSNDYFWLVGVTSWGKGCARARQPRLYTSTQHFYKWILLQMARFPAVPTTPAAQPSSSVPSQKPKTTPAQSATTRSCPFPQQKLIQFFSLLQELLNYMWGSKAAAAG